MTKHQVKLPGTTPRGIPFTLHAIWESGKPIKRWLEWEEHMGKHRQIVPLRANCDVGVVWKELAFVGRLESSSALSSICC